MISDNTTSKIGNKTMTGTKHTPGPWVSRKDSGGWYIYGDEDADSLVAEFTHYEPEVDSANALLIAAAPELLAALEELAAGVERFIHPQPDKPDSTWAKLVRARAAIAKATQEE